MRNPSTKLCLFIISLSISLFGWAGNPCMPIAQACMKAGFYKGGNTEGKGLIEDCVMPIVAKQKSLPNNTFSEETLQQCNMMLKEKMKAKNQ